MQSPNLPHLPSVTAPEAGMGLILPGTAAVIEGDQVRQAGSGWQGGGVPLYVEEF